VKEKVLAILRQAGDGFVSGEEISKHLKITRTAVWKHIETLRKEGYGIEASPRRGYRINSVPDFLYPWEIHEGLKTAIFGRRIYHFHTVDSTNRLAKELAEKGAEEGTVVIAEQQTEGRGRLGRDWVSPKGGIWMSVILRPHIQPHRAAGTTLVAAVALSRALEEVAELAPRIKWPNDIIVKGKKVCGVLTEMKAEMDIVEYVIQGIGLNANLGTEELKRLPPTASSLQVILGEPVDRKVLVREILLQIESFYEVFLAGRAEKILEQWKHRDCILGQYITVKQGDEEHYGLAHDITPEGGLVVRDSRGNVRVFYSGEVTIKK